MTYRHLKLEISDHIASVRLNRPPVNALNRELVSEMTSVAREFQSARDTWVVTLTAEGKTFSAGADLKERASIRDEEVLSVVQGIQAMTYQWMLVPQPVIVGIQGPALGGGLELALSGDILVGAESVRLGFPEVSLGIIPAAGGTQRLAQRTSLGVAKKWILTAKQYTAREALADGVLDFLYPDQSFNSEFADIVAQISANAPLSLRQAKSALNASYDEWLRHGLGRELDSYAPLIKTHDRKEALLAFAEKRKPGWEGK